MTQISTTTVHELGAILGIWAHPDDETYSMAGLAAAATRNGQQVTLITATRGEQGVQDESKWPQATLGETREKELEEALSILGVENHTWLDYPDGGLSQVDETEAVGLILSLLEKHRPNTIITFPPDGITGHPDHITVGRWAKLALERYTKDLNLYYTVNLQNQYDEFLRELDEKYNVFFNIDEPTLVTEADCDIYLNLTPDICNVKCSALAAMPSQTAKMFAEYGQTKLEKLFCQEAFVRADRDIRWGAPRTN